MKKLLGVSAILLVAVGLAGCSDQNKNALEQNLLSTNDKNSYEITISKLNSKDSDGEGANLKDFKAVFGNSPKMSVNLNKKHTVAEIDTKIKSQSGPDLSTEIFMNKSEVVMSTKSFAEQMRTQLKEYKDVEVPGLSKIEDSYLSLGPELQLSDGKNIETGQTELQGYLKNFKGKGISKSQLDSLFKDKKVTKNKKNYLQVVLTKKDFKRVLDARDDMSKQDRKDANSELKKLKTMNVTLLNKGSKTLYEIKATDTDKDKLDINFTMKSKKTNKKVKMPEKSKIVSAEELAKDLTPKEKK